MVTKTPNPLQSKSQGNAWQSSIQRSCASLSQLDSPESSLCWALQLLPVYSNTQEFVCPAGASFSSELHEPKQRHAAFLLHFLDVALAIQDNLGIPPGHDLPNPKQRRRLKAIINRLSPEQYLEVILSRTFGSHHKVPRPFIGYYFKNAEEPPPTPVQMADCAVGMTDDCLPAMVGDDISGLSSASAWYYYGGVNVAGIHAEDAWLHSINAAVLPPLNTTLLEGCIEPDGIWALQTSLRLSVCKLWTFAPQQMLIEDRAVSMDQ
ncbi:hypothetical protein DUNSADRAFT_7064 [Dunaliella salina]|uniref:Uncharacterized protein n=1 Tax=Dunaliella salina TaxID=3046 RepID=A0ABQ7H6H0_DUNSA|nr:hypothetical protein DUNSADRAFT_7064 [Dunaliella salina]|eukprot:KAF5842455.1 hypothetical protein DUNSADRAFT_7064 [Dunaliella salina]